MRPDVSTQLMLVVRAQACRMEKSSREVEKENSVAKANKKLKKLGKADLLELLVEHSKEVERLKEALAESEAARLEAERAYEELLQSNAELAAVNGEFERDAERIGSVSDEAVRRVMSGAGQAVEEIVAGAQQEAEGIVSEAREQAEGIVSDAWQQADDILFDARQQAEEVVAEANDEAAVIRKYTKMLLVDSKAEAARTEGVAHEASDKLLAQTRRICSDLLAQAQGEIDALFDEADARAAGGLR